MTREITRLWQVAAILLLVCTPSGATRGQTSEPEAADDDRDAKTSQVYTVSEYDPKREAAQDLAATVKKAKQEGKRIILEIGGDW